jgi:hypothetical protein
VPLPFSTSAHRYRGTGFVQQQSTRWETDGEQLPDRTEAAAVRCERREAGGERRRDAGDLNSWYITKANNIADDESHTIALLQVSPIAC